MILPETNPAKGKGEGEGGEMPSSIQTGVHLYVRIGLFFVAIKLRRELKGKSGKLSYQCLFLRSHTPKERNFFFFSFFLLEISKWNKNIYFCVGSSSLKFPFGQRN